MLFSSIPFLFYFLPLTMALYFIAPDKLKNSVLLLVSLLFYGWGEPRYLIFMLFAILQGYVLGLLIGKYRETKAAKPLLALSVIISLGLLCYCKYTDFFIANFNAVTGLSIPLLKIALPIGISFYTFQILSYTVDVYRGEVPSQKNIINFAAYVAMFPQLIAGPIVRYSDVAAQLEHRTHTLEKASYGVKRFAVGLAKKILLANVLGELVNDFKSSGEQSVLFVWLYAIAYTLHIYFDFSGYSDMAIGLGKIFGFDYLENFNYPYISSSITEFWRRWHMSLGSWFRDYLYIPLGGNRVPKWRWFLNILIVWMATGFWHGAEWTFILWGLMYAVLLVIEKLWLLKHMPKAVGHVYTLLFVILGFVLFDAANIGGAFANIGAMFGGAGLPASTAETIYCLKNYGIVLIIAIIGATPLPAKLLNRVKQYTAGEKVIGVFEPIYCIAILAVCTAFLVDGSFNPFLYFRF